MQVQPQNHLKNQLIYIMKFFFSVSLILFLLSGSSLAQSGITDSATGIGVRFKTRQITTDTTLTGTADHTLLADASGGAFTVNLPAAGTNNATRELVIVKTDSSANAVTIDGFGSEAIAATSTVKLTWQYQSVRLQAGFSGWHIVGQPPANVYTVTATATLTADQLYGSQFVNTGASGSIVLTLPAPARGMRFRVYLTAAQDVDINPADGTQILALTNATGDAISSAATVGNAIELVALSATTWGAYAASGTWTDVN